MNTHTNTYSTHIHAHTHAHTHEHTQTHTRRDKHTHMHAHTHSLTVLASQREMVLSAEQVQRVLENGRNLTAFTESAWPLSVTTH